MIKNLIVCLAFVLISIDSYSQVGIGNTSPKALLDITASSRTSPNALDGLLVPRVNVFPPITTLSADQNAMIIYITGTGTVAKGFYYWNATEARWVPFVRKIDDLQDGKSDNDGTQNGSSIFLGVEAGLNDDSANRMNVGVGYNAMRANTVGYQNTAIGYQSLENNIGGFQNVALGYQTSQKNVAGVYNVAIGYQTLKENVNGNSNSGIGSLALRDLTTGDNNVAIGVTALNSLTNGSRNVAAGRNSATKLQRGDNNTIIGFEAGVELLNASGNVFLGRQAGGQELGSNLLYIENSNTLIPLIGGNFANDRVGVNRAIVDLTNTFEVGGTASKATSGAWLANSDRRLKKNIETISGETALDKISKMNGVYYEWNDSKTGMPRPEGKQLGFVAQELMEVFPEKVTKDNLGYYQTAYGDYDALYVQAIKALKQELEAKEAQINALELRLKTIEDKLNKL